LACCLIWYGIIGAEVVPKTLSTDKIEELKEEVPEFSKTTETRDIEKTALLAETISTTQEKEIQTEETTSDETIQDNEEITEEQPQQTTQDCWDYDAGDYYFSWTTPNWETKTISHSEQQTFKSIPVWNRTFSRTIKCGNWNYTIVEDDTDWEIEYLNWYNPDDKTINCKIWDLDWKKEWDWGDKEWGKCEVELTIVNPNENTVKNYYIENTHIELYSNQSNKLYLKDSNDSNNKQWISTNNWDKIKISQNNKTYCISNECITIQ